MKKCHKADHTTIVELRDAYRDVVLERERALTTVGTERRLKERYVEQRDAADTYADGLALELVQARNAVAAVREFAWGLGASTASRADILDALTRQPFAPSGPGTLAPTETLDVALLGHRFDEDPS